MLAWSTVLQCARGVSGPWHPGAWHARGSQARGLEHPRAAEICCQGINIVQHAARCATRAAVNAGTYAQRAESVRLAYV